MPQADIAQLVERLHGKEKVRGPNPRVGSTLKLQIFSKVWSPACPEPEPRPGGATGSGFKGVYPPSLRPSLRSGLRLVNSAPRFSRSVGGAIGSTLHRTVQGPPPRPTAYKNFSFSR